MHKLLLPMLLTLMIHLVFADISDLEQLVNKLDLTPVTPISPKLPEYKVVNTNYVELDQNNLFDEGRSALFEKNNDLQKYNLDKLQMVGFMSYEKIDYAFLKTPYEVIKVKIGDKVRNGNVIGITSNSVQIDELQLQDGKAYTKKIYLKLNQPKQKMLPKLNLQ